MDIIPKNYDSLNESRIERKKDLAACFHLIDYYGMSDIIWNHISAKVPGTSDQFYINPFCLRYDEITSSNLLTMNFQGDVIEGDQSFNQTGFVIHSAIHEVRPDIQCVLHTHTIATMAISATKEGFIPFVQDGSMFAGKIGYHSWQGLSSDIEEKKSLASDLGKNGVLFLRNHGVVTVGRTVGEAFMRMYYLEKACKVQLELMKTGMNILELNPEVLEKTSTEYEKQYPLGKYEWLALKRFLDKKQSIYAQ